MIQSELDFSGVCISYKLDSTEGGVHVEEANATGAQVDLFFGVVFYLSQPLGGQASSLCEN